MSSIRFLYEVTMNCNWEYYKIFYFVGKCGSFTQAAKLLNNNQPNITRVINALESDLGCRLFVRTKKGVALTPEGEKLFVHVEAAYHQIQSGEEELSSEQLLQNGSFSISISEIALHVLMLPILQRFKSKYPGIRIQVFNHSTPQGIKALEQGLVDLAVVSSPVYLSKTLEAAKIRSFQDILIGGEPYYFLNSKKHSLKEITKYPLITLRHETTSYSFLKDLFLSQNIVLEPSIEVATTDQILPMVAHGMGLGFVPVEFAKTALDRKEVFTISLTSNIPPRDIVLIQDKSRPLNMATQELRKEILNTITRA